MAEQPPLNRFYVASYAANDRDFPIVAIRLDPRVAGYRVPEDLSPHPDSKRYPNHVFTGSQPSNGDERVTHIYEILPSPWVPFTRYDDDLGPIQGRRRSVKNEGQQASLTSSTKISYEGREGSAVVSNEIEESWSISVDEDGNSLFPIKDRDFYDASRGPVQERRQLFVPTGEEKGSLENIDGVITQTSYEPYNEFLSVKIVQTYSVNGPQLIGQVTDEARQLATVTTQRKGADGYIPATPSATRTVEVSREDAESLVERIVEVPEVFGAQAYRTTKEDLTPQKFKAKQQDSTVEVNIAGTANPNITLGTGEFVKSEEQVNKFVKRVSTTSRVITSAVTLNEKILTPEGQIGSRVLTLANGVQSFTPSATLIDASVEDLGDGRTVKTETTVPNVFAGTSIAKSKIDLTPEKFKAKQEDTTTEETVAGTISPSITLGSGEFRKSEQQVTEFVKRVSTTSRDITSAFSLEEKVLTPQGQLATRVLRLANGTQNIQPNAKLIDGSIEELGDGRTIKTEVRVDTVFDEKQESKQKPDIIPPEFRASLQDLTTAEVKSGTDANVGQLAKNVVSKTVQRITEHKIRETKTVRAQGPYPELDEELIDNDGVKISRKKTVVNGAQSITPTATVSGQVQALGDGYTLKVEDTKAKVFRGSVFSKEKPDNIPVEFRAEKPATTEEFSEEGEAQEVSLSDDEIAKSEQQVTEFVKRVRTTTRELTGSVELNGEQVDEDGVKVSVTRTLADGAQSITPSATVRGQVEAIGDDKTIKTELTREEIFEGQTFSIEKPEVIPIAFRAEKPAEVDEKTVEGDVEKPSLEGDEISKSEQQITKFLKRIRTTTRENVDTVELKDEQINQFGQKVDVTRTLKKTAQSIDPSATISGRVESLGDNYTLKTEEVLPKVFDQKLESASKPDVFPEQFRASVPTKTTQEIIEKTDVEPIELEKEEIEISEQRITDHTVRTTRVYRNDDNFPILKGQEYDQSANIIIPYNESIVSSGEKTNTPSATVDPLSSDYDLVREFDLDAIGTELENIFLEFPTRTSFSLPPVLKKVQVVFSGGNEDGDYQSSGERPEVGGGSVSASGSATATATAKGEFLIQMENVFSNNIPTTSYVFFLKYPISINDILEKTGSIPWPVFKPNSHTLIAAGTTKSVTVSSQGSYSSVKVSEGAGGSYYTNTKTSGSGGSSSIQNNISTVVIPPCLSGGVAIEELGAKSHSATATINFNWGSMAISESKAESVLATAGVYGTISPSTPADIPRSGKYLIDSRVEIYQYGYARVYAEVLDASVFA